MKKITLFMILAAVFAISATTVTDYLTDKTVKSYAENIVGSYQWMLKNYPRKTKLNLCSLSGHNLGRAVITLDSTVEYDEWNKQYRSWLTDIVLTNRKSIISQLNDNKLNQFIALLNQAAIDKGLSSIDRENLLKEIRDLLNYYVAVLQKLQAATPAQRTAIFTEVTKIAPRNKAYGLQMSLNKTGGYDDKALLVSYAKLDSSLAEVGITLAKTCDDFHDYKFTRYSRQFDYLFSITRWATYMDKGSITENAIIGWKEPTIKALVDDGLVLVKKLKKATLVYKP